MPGKKAKTSAQKDSKADLSHPSRTVTLKRMEYQRRCHRNFTSARAVEMEHTTGMMTDKVGTIQVHTEILSSL